MKKLYLIYALAERTYFDEDGRFARNFDPAGNRGEQSVERHLIDVADSDDDPKALDDLALSYNAASYCFVHETLYPGSKIHKKGPGGCEISTMSMVLVVEHETLRAVRQLKYGEAMEPDPEFEGGEFAQKIRMLSERIALELVASAGADSKTWPAL